MLVNITEEQRRRIKEKFQQYETLEADIALNGPDPEKAKLLSWISGWLTSAARLLGNLSVEELHTHFKQKIITFEK